MPRKERDLVFLFDVDNTLLDNDKSKADIQAALLDVLGNEGAGHFWDLYEQVRQEYDVVDYPETVKRFAANWGDQEVARKVDDIVTHWPYKDYLYPGTLDVLAYVTKMGEVAILSDGDTVYQPRKIANAGLAHAVGGESDVLIFTHKETNLKDITRELPGKHYVFVDDKERLLAIVKSQMGETCTTVWVKQGHYADDPKQYQKPDPDFTLQAIAELCNLTKADFTGESYSRKQSEPGQ